MISVFWNKNHFLHDTFKDETTFDTFTQQTACLVCNGYLRQLFHESNMTAKDIISIVAKYIGNGKIHLSFYHFTPRKINAGISPVYYKAHHSTMILFKNKPITLPSPSIANNYHTDDGKTFRNYNHNYKLSQISIKLVQARCAEQMYRENNGYSISCGIIGIPTHSESGKQRIDVIKEFESRCQNSNMSSKFNCKELTSWIHGQTMGSFVFGSKVSNAFRIYYLTFENMFGGYDLQFSTNDPDMIPNTSFGASGLSASNTKNMQTVYIGESDFHMVPFYQWKIGQNVQMKIKYDKSGNKGQLMFFKDNRWLKEVNYSIDIDLSKYCYYYVLQSVKCGCSKGKGFKFDVEFD